MIGGKITTKSISAGKTKYLKSASVKAELGRRAARGAKIAGGGRVHYESDTYTGKNRARASIMARSPHARRHNAKTNAIIKAVTSGRL